MAGEGWNDYRFETGVFQYSLNQFMALRGATRGLSWISLLSSLMIIAVYIVILNRDRGKANRVSLRCVFFCAIMEALNSVLNMFSTHNFGETTFCKAASLIIVASNLLSTSLLTVVGLNLVLIFVIKVKRAELLERFYYPGILIYTFIGIVGPIQEDISVDVADADQFSCWYYLYIEDRTYSTYSWMWFYGFIFFANIIAILCSVVAMAKLMHERHVLNRKMSITSKDTSTPQGQSDLKAKEQQNKIFTKVVLRCIIYPLVPFLANIFGFALQVKITKGKYAPGYYLTMLDIVFSCIQGFFVAIVFFTDPAVTSFLKESFHDMCEKYVHEYTLMPINNFKIIEQGYSLPDDPNSRVVVSTTISDYHGNLNEKVRTVQVKKREMPIRRIMIEYDDISMNDDTKNTFSSEMQSTKHGTGFYSTSSSFTETKFAYKPYKHPRLAKHLNRVLKGLGIKPRETPQVATEDIIPFSSFARSSSNVDVPLISKPKNVLLV